ncbi:EamA family transporter [Rivibacter subsaxonicus]|nr:EamA family transporter [Rivibacter subsaxonicus]
MTSLSIPLPRRHLQPLPPLILLCLAATWLVWGSTYLAIKFSLASFPPFVGMGSRFIVAGLLLAAWMRWVRRAPWPDARQWRHALVLGALMLGGGMGGTAFAEQSVGSGLVVAFIAIVPVMMAAGQALMGHWPRRLEAVGIGIGLLGVLLLTQGQGFGGSTAGLVAIALACLTWTIGSLLSQKRLPLAPGAMGFASEMICGGLVLLLMATIADEWPVLAAQWPPEPLAVASWIYLVVAGSLIAFNAYMVLLARAPQLASSYCYVNPVIALLLGTTLGGEAVSRGEWLSAGVVLLGVVLLLAGQARSQRAAA